MLKSGILPRPVLAFRKGTSIHPFKALGSGFCPLTEMRKLTVKFCSAAKVSGEMKDLAKALDGGYGLYRGFSWTFCTDFEYYFEEVAGEDELEKISPEGADVTVYAVPDESYVPEDRDYYIPLKQLTAGAGEPTQMVNYSTLRRASRNPYILFNLALNIYGKAGGKAWGIAGGLEGEVHVGVDVAGNYAVATLLTDTSRPDVTWEYEANPAVEIAESLDMLMYRIAVENEEKFRHARDIVVYRDGAAHWSEVKRLRGVFARLKMEGIVPPEAGYSLVEVRKRIAPRIYRVAGDKILNPIKGTYLLLGKNTAIVATSGAPERPLPSLSGLVRPLAIRLVDTSNWETGILSLARNVYWLAQLHWGSAFTTPRLPITTLYAHKIARFLSIGAYPHQNLKDKLWFL